MKTFDQIYRQHDGKVSDKWSLYLSEYERLFAPYRNRPIRILEIGVQNGGSLELWGKYFPQAEKIIGCDLNPKCGELAYDDTRISIVVGNANAERTLRQILKRSESFDIVIDDGSHHSRDIVCSFIKYFSCLTEGGLYIAEDLHCSYWQEYMGGLYHPGSSVAFFKLLVDVINREHWGIEKARTELLHTFERYYGARTAEDLLRKIHSIEFINSLCVIRKCNDQSNLLGARAVAGVHETIAPMRAANGTVCPTIDQRENSWAAFRQVNESELLRSEIAAQRELAERDAALEQIKKRLEAVSAGLIAASAGFATREETTAVQRNRLEVQLAESGCQLRSTAEQLAAVKTERGSLEAALASSRQQNQLGSAQLAVIKTERDSLDAALTDARQQIQVSAAQLAVTKTVRDSLDAALADARQQIQISTAQLASAKAERSSLQSALADVQKGLYVTAAQLAAAKIERGSLESALADARQHLQSMEAKLAASKAERGSFEAAVGKVRHELGSTTAQLDATQAELDAAKTQLAESTAELARQSDVAARQRAELEAQRAASQERAIAAEARRESLQAEHDGVLNSTFWRATAPARRLGAVLPQGVRRQARRGARLLYWVLTPHRTPARIADRRARSENLEKSNTPAWAELFDRNWYLARYPDVAAGADKNDPLRHFIHHGAAERRDPNPFFNTSWYLESNPDVARAGDSALAHYFEHGAAEDRDPSPPFDTSWYLEAHSDVAKAGTNPLLHYLRHGASEGRGTRAAEPPATSPHDAIFRVSLANLATNRENYGAVHYPELEQRLEEERVVARRREAELQGIIKAERDAAYHNKKTLDDFVIRLGQLPPELSPDTSQTVTGSAQIASIAIPDLTACRSFRPRHRIAAVVHVHFPEIWPEIEMALTHIADPFDLFVSVTKDSGSLVAEEIRTAFPKAQVFTFPVHGRDLLPFLSFAETGVLNRYELICKIHTKRSVQVANGDEWRHQLIDGILHDDARVRDILRAFELEPDLGIVVADGNVCGQEPDHWRDNTKRVIELGERIGITAIPPAAAFPAGSMYWIRPFLLRSLAALDLKPADFEPEPIRIDGMTAHAVERLVGLVCSDAGMRIAAVSEVLAPKPPIKESGIKTHIIAYYLPQFHPIPENDEWWGKGFTEWANVTRAKPQFRGHRQPRLPADLGFYDLRLPEVREAQAEMAKAYGISAFCYYYYWFDGRGLLRKPLVEMLESDRPDFPFLLCWANEPWTRNWDGGSREMLLPQTYADKWPEAFAADVAPILADRRYFRFNGRPVLLIYRVMHIPNTAEALGRLRRELKRLGVGDIHLGGGWVGFADDVEPPADPHALGLDAYFGFPPHRTNATEITDQLAQCAPDFVGHVYSYDSAIEQDLIMVEKNPDDHRHRAVMLAWDNTARRMHHGHVMHGATPAKLRRWLRGLLRAECGRHGPKERMIFVNAWNEWAEGAYLEPDRAFGLGWLEAIASGVAPPIMPLAYRAVNEAEHTAMAS